MTKHASILEREAYFGFYIGGLSPCSKSMVMGQANDSFGKKKTGKEKRKKGCTTSLINRSMNKYPQFH